MMKRIWLLIVACMSMQALSAQKTVHGSGFLDDWSVGMVAGVRTPTTHAAFWQSMRPVYGLEMTKYIVPEFGLGAQLITAHRTTASTTVFDETQLMLMGHLNLSNLMASYLGRPRSFELIAVIGAGWGHHFYNSDQGSDYDFMATKFGLDLKFFLDRHRYAWALHAKPSIVYNMDAGHTEPSFHVNKSSLELLVGVTYHFKNANNGKHHFTLMRPYDRTEVEALNAKVNGLHRQAKVQEAALKQARQEIETLKQQLKAAEQSSAE